MKKIIKNNQLEFLKKQLEDEFNTKKLIARRLLKNNHLTDEYEIELRDFDKKHFINVLSDLFARIGLNADSEPNATGLLIEDLIDIIGSQ